MATINNPESAKKAGRLDNIDLLRAAAIISVVIYHYTSRFPAEFYRATVMPINFSYGRYGVDLFFVVSAFCIFMTLEASKTLERFWARRIARIQPGYMAGIALTFLIVASFGLPGRTISVWVALSNMVWANIIPNWPSVDGAYWSLIVELKFYFWIGLFYYIFSGRYLSVIWAAFSVLGMALNYLGREGGYGGHAVAQFSDLVMLAPFAPQFFVGLLAYESRRLKKATSLGLACVAASLIIVSPRYLGEYWIGLFIALAGFSVLKMPFLRVPRPITFVGLISYSLYVVHQNIGYVIIREFHEVIPSIALRIFVASLFVVATASLLFLLIETRWQRNLTRLLESLLLRLFGYLPFRRRRMLDPDPRGLREW